MTTPFTNELIAVNRMLQSIGERGVNSLTDQKRLDVSNAVSILDEVRVLTQTRGWWFNSETEITLSPTAGGEYVLPENVVKADLIQKTTNDVYTQRGDRLYNLTTRQTIGHTADIVLDWVKILPFDDMPENARLYIARRAGVTYQARVIGSPILFEFTERDALEAWGLLLQAELDNQDLTLETSPLMFDAVHRR